MKREITLIQDLLEYFREHADSREILKVPNGDQLKSKYQVEDDIIHYHVELCVQAEFLKVVEFDEVVPGTHIPKYGILYLTWWGHEFLERNQTGKRPSIDHSLSIHEAKRRQSRS